MEVQITKNEELPVFFSIGVEELFPVFPELNLSIICVNIEVLADKKLFFMSFPMYTVILLMLPFKLMIINFFS